MTETREWHGVAAEVRSQNFPWWTLLITGLLGVAFGIAVLVWPDITLRVMAALAGVWLFIAGCARIIGAFLPSGSIVRNVLSGIVGIIVLIAGVICLRNVVTRLALLALLFAITWILSGLTAVIVGTQREGTERTVLIIVGVVSLIAGLVFVFAPGLSLASLVILTGISSIVVGAGEVGLAFVVRRANAVAA
ncbi:HdeD family acid-resistance protein [Actinoplanes sp. CA-030573]|uniref:HdeD family acid-resistance protein n=1 Tax=Actinoplanes sp. CA-030573 TaxID=3239898 RepID=UPI003D8B12C0